MAYYYARREVIELIKSSQMGGNFCENFLAPRIEQGNPAVFDDWNFFENLYDTILEREKRSRERFGIVERV